MNLKYKILYFLQILIFLQNIFSLTSSKSNSIIFNETAFDISDHKIILGHHVKKIGCNLNPIVVFVYIDFGSSLRLSSRILQHFHQCGITTIVLREENKKKFYINDDGVKMYFLAIIRNADSLFSIRHIRKHSGDKHRSYFIILVENSESLTRLWLRNAFQEFWNLWILNVIIIYYKFNQILVYSYTPFSEINFLKKLSSENILKHQLFRDQLPNMNKSPFRISMYPERVRAIFPTKNDNSYRGVDGQLSDFIIKRLNATKIVVIPKPKQSGNIFINGSADGGIGSILRDEADIEMNSRFLLPGIFKNKVEFTNVFGRDDLCIMVPKSQHASLFFNIFRCFQRNVWLMILITLVVSSVALKFLNRNKFNENITNLFSGICSVPILVKKDDNLKIFFGFWLTFCFFINGAYKCNLTCSLVSPISFKEYENLEDLINFPYTILAQDRYLKQLTEYMEYPFQMYPEIREKILNVSFIFMLQRVRNGSLNYGYIEKEHIIDNWVEHKNNSRNGQPLYHKMKMCPVPLLVVYIVQYGSPYLGYINTLLRRVDEHGFLEYWNRLYEGYNILKERSSASNSETKHQHGPKVLKLKHLQATFFLLLIGLGISSLVLIGELFWKRQQFEKFSTKYR